MRTNPGTLARLSAAERTRQDQRGQFAPVSALNPELDAMLAALSMSSQPPPGVGADRARKKRKERIAKASKRRNRK